MRTWLRALRRMIAKGQPAVLVSVANAKGSTPRDAGTKMIVTTAGLIGTVGGGHLEFRAQEVAREMLRIPGSATPLLQEFQLGPSLGQCCGGHTTLLFERIATADLEWIDALEARLRDPGHATIVTRLDTGDKLILTEDNRSGSLGSDILESRLADLVNEEYDGKSWMAEVDNGKEGTSLPLLFETVRDEATTIALFGAGHVGKAIVHILGPLPNWRIRWIDGRADAFPGDVPDTVEIMPTDDPVGEVDDLPSGAVALVMTHSHAIDYDIVERLLKRGDFLFCGLIGSRTKRAQFLKRLAARGMAPEAIQRLTCPIGIDGINGKHPSEIAVAVAAEILQLDGRRSETDSVKEVSA